MNTDKREIWSGAILIGLFIVILFALGFSGCSPNWHIKRAVKKNPAILQVDTLVHIDTVRINTNRVEVDSVFMVSNDTVTIIKDNLTIRHFIHNDSVFIDGSCDTIFIDVVREIKVPFEKVVINNPLFPKWMIWFLALFVLFILVNRFIK